VRGARYLAAPSRAAAPEPVRLLDLPRELRAGAASSRRPCRVRPGAIPSTYGIQPSPPTNSPRGELMWRRIDKVSLDDVARAPCPEVDERRLYLPAAYPSIYSYCVGELRLCEQAAFKRIRAARTARRFPAIFPALAEGRLHLSGVVMLTPYLTPENADELLAAAANRNRAEPEQPLAQRFPR